RRRCPAAKNQEDEGRGVARAAGDDAQRIADCRARQAVRTRAAGARTPRHALPPLSVISLHSGALEVGDVADPELASTASALRQEARASLEDLRHLVGGVRDGNLAD